MNGALYCQHVVLEHSVRASRQIHADRRRLFLVIESGGVRGFGEVAPQPYALNGDAGFDDVVVALNDALLRVVQVEQREGGLPSWSRVARLFATSPAQRMAAAIKEMALLDRELRCTRTPSSELWPKRFDTPSQATVSLLDDRPWSIAPHVQRVRVKLGPGEILPAALEQLGALTVPVLLDYNCSALSDDGVLEHVRQLERVVYVSAVEQPYDVGNVVDHARLQARLPVALSLDEGLRSTHDLEQILRYKAASMICVKPARVGGLANARTIIQRAGANDLAVYVGGFFESPYARAVHRALARSLVNEPSDVDDVSLRAVNAVDEVTPVESRFGVEPSAQLLAQGECLAIVA
ncbi:MAG: enolase C-terminal domain-like protein [Acidimicrobiales bacterium]